MSSQARRTSITVSNAALRSWWQSGMRLVDIQRKIEDLYGWAPKVSTLSKWIKDLGEEPRHKSRRTLNPWDVLPEHRNSRWRRLLHAAERRANGETLSATALKDAALLDDLRTGRGVPLVVGYHEEVGYYLTDATPEEAACGAIIRFDPIARLDLELPAEDLAREALRYGVTPEQLEDVGQSPAADLLRQLGQPAVSPPQSRPRSKKNVS